MKPSFKGFRLLCLECAAATHHLVEIDLMTVELGAVNAGELSLAAYCQTTAAAHSRAVYHYRVHGSNSGNTVLLSQLTDKLHHDKRTDSDADAGQQAVKITSQGKVIYFIIYVSEKPMITVNNIVLNTSSVKRYYGTAEPLDLSGLIVTALY